MPCPVTLLMLRANRGCRLARTQDDGAVAHCGESEDAPGAGWATWGGTQVAPR